MQRFYEIVRDLNGNPTAGCEVVVYVAGTSTPADIYEAGFDNVDSSTAKSNPFVTDSSGIVSFAARNGRYTIYMSGGNTLPRQLPWITFLDGQDGGIDTGTLAQFAPTTSAQLATVITDETGTGKLVFADNAALGSPTITTPTISSPAISSPTVTDGTYTSPTLVTPVLGVATATSINTTTIPTGKTLVVTTDKLSALASTSSSELKGVISDETGSGALVFATSPTLVTPVLGDALATTLTLDKASGKGIKVDTAAPTYAWVDLMGNMRPDTGGAGAPTLAVFRAGACRSFFYSLNDLMDTEFHLPHDLAPGTDVYVHVHWGHNGTAISGNIVFTLTSTYAKGHNQAAFPAEKAVTITYDTTNIATTPRYQHRIDEVAITSSGGSATLWDNGIFEPDGILLLNLKLTTLPTITGGSTNEPAIFFIDLHYQSTGIGTKQKAPNFYT